MTRDWRQQNPSSGARSESWTMGDSLANGLRRVVARPNLCRGCEACMLACSLYHERRSWLGLSRLTVTKDMRLFEFRIDICKHCSKPKCVADCPSDAIRLSTRGVVTIDQEKCTRCGICRDLCPFGAIFHSKAADRYIKCDLCIERKEGPLCVQLCPSGALSLPVGMPGKPEE